MGVKCKLRCFVEKRGLPGAGDAGLPVDPDGAEDHRKSEFQVRGQKHLYF